jgi:hypothetical protein
VNRPSPGGASILLHPPAVARLGAFLAWAAAACVGSPPPPGSAATSVATSSAVAAASPVPAPAPALDGGGVDAGGILDAGPVESGGSTGGTDGGVDGGARAPFVADNAVAPLADEEDLQRRAKGLLDAIAADDPSLADPFWFPKEPFVPLKDVKNPGKYWETLHHSYGADVHELHRKRKSWDGVAFVRFEVGSTPTWVDVGEEANHIGYYRSFRGTLRYAAPGGEGAIEVHTLITWQGRWYVTHLRKIKK